MNGLILEKLKDIEREYNVKVLYACESGSRAWGFPSKDSDYDVRFIYLRKTKDYLRLIPYRDVIEYELDEVYDINGWDLKKFLLLLGKSNPVIFEWLSAKIVYYEDELFKEYKKEFLKAFSPDKSIAHYGSIANKTYKNFIMGKDEVRYKKYFYVLRPLLCIKWIKQYQSIPPIEFELLKNEFLKGEISECVRELLIYKQNSKEVSLLPAIPVLNDYIEQALKEHHRIDKTPLPINIENLFLKFIEEKI